MILSTTCLNIVRATTHKGDWSFVLQIQFPLSFLSFKKDMSFFNSDLTWQCPGIV